MTENLGRYEILQEIGQGGFATVYRAMDSELGRLVALKELKQVLLQDESWTKRFRREARAIARLDHPHIVTVYDITEVEGRLFIVMRLVDGPSLAELISARGQLTWQDSVEITTPLAEGLDYAHSQGVLHRDLKPANILIDPERGPQLTDFGLAKLTGDNSMSVSATGSVVGTPHYIAPEVWEGQSATAQADIYAFGCILFEMITGEKVFKGETPPAVMMAHFKPLELPRTWPEGVPGGITDLFKTALASQPANRYTTAGKMAAELAALPDGKFLQPAPVVEQSKPDPSIPETGEAQTGSPDVTEESGATSAERAADRQGQPKAMLSEPPVGEASSPEPAGVALPPPAAPAPTRAGATPKAGRRSGCKWLTVLVIIGVVLLVGIGLGGLCSAAGGLFTLGNIFNSLPTVEMGSTQEKEILVLPPDTPGLVEVDLKFDAGNLFITPDAAIGLLAGTATYNVPQLEPRVITSSNMVRLEHETALGLANITAPNIENTWDLKLGPTPMKLDIEAGMVRQGEFELGGLPLHELTINPGAGEMTVSFSEVNPVEMENLQFKTHAAKADLMGLANAHALAINLDGTAGEYLLDFSGALQADLAVKVNTTSFSEVTLIVPDDTAAQVSLKGQGTTVNVGGSWQESGDDYLNSGAGYEIMFDINIGAGTLNLRNQ